LQTQIKRTLYRKIKINNTIAGRATGSAAAALALMETIYGKINDRLWCCQLKTNKQAPSLWTWHQHQP